MEAQANTQKLTYEQALAALPAKRRRFVVEYLATLNKTEAARRAKYAKPSEEGYRLLRNAQVAEVVRLGMSEQAMPREEVVARLAEHARGDMREFIVAANDGAPIGFDLSPDRPLHLIKKLKITRRQLGAEDDAPIVETIIDFELYDAKSALDSLARIHGLFIDRKELTGKDGGPIAIDDIKQRLLDRLTAFDAEEEAPGVSGAPEPG